ncbi:MAG: recombinase family protein [Ruminococcaceae bacterium]|nr:recombinase family protein [Oscillospiraceae bacterium]
MKRAIAYARFSSDLQREESIDAQLRAIRKYCDEHDFVLLATYADKGISGTSDNRPEFQKMIATATKGNVDAVIVHKLDRFARNRYDSAFYKNILKKNNVKLISVLENLQDSPESVILESVIEGMNEYYSLNLSREVRKGLQENALECKVTGGPPALGYSVDRATQKYVINEYEAEAVRMIFRMYLDGYSYTEIIDALNAKGYRTRRGVTFAKNSLYAILRNERYTGVYIYVKDSTKNSKGKYVRHGEYEPEAVIRIPGGIPAIISEQEFQLVQAKMKERQHKAAKFSAKQEYLLSGKIYCGECGSPYAGNSRKPRPDHPLYISYKCTRRNQRDTKCNNPEINRDKLERLVLERLSEVLFNPDVIPRLVEQYNEYIAEKTGSVRERMLVLQTELRDVERKITNTVNLMIETGSAAFKDKLNELEQSKEKLLFELTEAEAALKQENFSEEQICKLFHIAEQQLKNGTLANRRLVIDQYINKIIIYPDKIEVYMNLMSNYTVKETIEQ